jgi:acyl-CoA-binding protein
LEELTERKMQQNSLVSPSKQNEKFEAAVARSSKLKHLSSEVKLKLYGYYKQATVGDCTSSEPSRWKMVENAKWHAWNELKGMMETNAKQVYIELVDQNDRELADTTEEKDEDLLPLDLKVSSKTKDQPTITVIVENSNVEKPRIIVEEELTAGSTSVTLANVEVNDASAPVSINLEPHHRSGVTTSSTTSSSSSTVIRSIHSISSRSESPLPTWVVFFLGVLFLCLLDDNITLGSVVMNSVGVSILTAAIISLQIR